MFMFIISNAVILVSSQPCTDVTKPAFILHLTALCPDKPVRTLCCPKILLPLSIRYRLDLIRGLACSQRFGVCVNP